MRSPRVSLPVAVTAGISVLLLAAALLALDATGTDASHAGGMDAMSIDVDITGNTATSLGPLDS